MMIKQCLLFILLICLDSPVKTSQDEPSQAQLVIMRTFASALMAKNKSLVISLIHYPVQVDLASKKRTIKSKNELLKYYDKIFTKLFLSELQRDLSWDNLLVDPQDGSLGLGLGQIWFSKYPQDKYLVSAINNEW